ncbi:MAG: DedA family protein, partial [Prevotella sp.]
YTTIGAGVWNMILAVLGYYLHSIVPEEHLNDKIMEYGEYIKIVIIALVVIAILFFVAKKYIFSPSKPPRRGGC